MPLLKVTARNDAISPAHRRALAPLLTGIILAHEVDHATGAGRRAAHVPFAEPDGARRCFTGGVPAGEASPGPGLILFEVTCPQGAAEQVEKTTLHRAIHAAAVRVLVGADAAANALATWIIVHDVPEDAWGMRDNTVSVTGILGTTADPGRIAHAKAVVAAGGPAAAIQRA